MATNFENISGEIQNSLLVDEENGGKGTALANWFKKKRLQLKPWTNFVNTKTFSTPKDVNHAAKRIMKNLDSYQANYIIICLFLSLYCMFVFHHLIFLISNVYTMLLMVSPISVFKLCRCYYQNIEFQFGFFSHKNPLRQLKQASLIEIIM